MAGIATVALLFACAEWPRFEHLPSDVEGLRPGTDPPPVVSVEWTHVEARGDEDDVPSGAPAESLSVGYGYILHGTTTGAGWDPDSVPERPAACGVASGFPSEETGDYLGDVDWRVIDLEEPGVLCSWLSFDGPVGADVLLYTLDSCGVALEPELVGTQVLGFGAEVPDVEWSVAIDAAQRRAAVAAAWRPDDPTLELGYLWSLALIPVPEDGQVWCPAPEGA